MLRRCVGQARVMQEEGAVVVELGLSASGHPTEAKVETSAGADLDAVFRGPMER
jgi:outer membrane biosynthesis protein TonB